VIQGPLELLASAFLHASWNAMLKREHRPQGAVLGVLASALVFAAAAAAALTLRNTSVVFAQLLALLLGERIPVRQWIGAAFVAAGAAVLSWPGPS